MSRVILIAFTISLLPLLVVLLVTSCRHTPETNPQRSAEWDRFVADYLENFFKLHPDLAVSAGRHEFDGQLPDWSRAGLKAMAKQYKTAHKRAQAFDPASLNPAQQIEREYMIAQIEGSLFWLEQAELPFRNPLFYHSFGGLDPSVYVLREYASLEVRCRAFTGYARAIPRATAQIRENLRTPMPATYVQLGRQLFGGLASFLADDVPTVFEAVNNPGLESEFGAANRKATEALRELDQWFAEQQASATQDFALGAGLFREMLRATERVDVSLEQLEAIGRRDLERNLASLEKACAVLAPDKSIPECVAMVTAQKPANGSVASAREQLVQLKQFLLDKDLVTIPSTEEALVNESPPFARWNAAYIDIPGAYDKGLPSTYYIAPPDPKWSAEEQSAYIPSEPDLLFISVHEVWPGHFLQFLHANRAQSKFGQVFYSYAFSEGWAHYVEELMWDEGLGGNDPATHIGQLLNALLRNVRFLSAIGLHSGRMTVAKSEQMFREKAFQDPANARQQAARGTFDPGYLNYTLGKLMILKLRDDWTATRGGHQAWKEFHDRLLSYGSPPIPIVRKAMLREEAGPVL
jgi:uncharacterized protein (DUF885 family)